VLPGDAPLIRSETLKSLLATHRAGKPPRRFSPLCSRSTATAASFAKGESQLGAIVEDSLLAPEQRELNEINSSIYCLLSRIVAALSHVKPQQAREIYLTDAIAELAAKVKTVLRRLRRIPAKFLAATHVPTLRSGPAFSRTQREEFMAGV